MYSRKNARISVSFLALIGVVFLAVMLFIYSFSLADNITIYKDFTRINTTNVQSPSVITINIPTSLRLGDALCFRSTHQEMFVYQNEKLLYKYEKDFSDSWGKSAISAWHIIPLDYSIKNSTIRIELFTPYESLFDFNNFFAFGNTVKMVEYVTVRALPSILISVVSIIIGSAIAIMLSLKSKKKGYNQLFSFAFFLIVTGIWSLGESQRMFFQIIPVRIDRFIYLLSFFFVTPLFFLTVSTLYKDKQKKFLIILSWIGFTIGILAGILQLFQIVDLLQSIYAAIILIFIGLIVILSFRIKNLRMQRSRIGFENLIIIMVMSVLICIEIYNFVRGDLDSIAFYVRCILIVFALIASIRFMRLQTKRARRLKRTKKKLALTKSNVIALKMRPHLIHNTLLSIQELCYSSSQAAVDAIGIFSKYLRSSFELTTVENLVPFTQELQYIREYIDVQKICYGDEIKYIEEIYYTNFDVPPLTLQPLIENGVKHGLRKRKGVGRITLTTKLHDNYIEIRIEDDGIGYKVESGMYDNKSSTKLILYRLKKLLNAKMYINSTIGKGTLVIVRFKKGGDR